MSKDVTRLIKQFQPEHYDLRIDPDVRAMTFRGSVTVTGKKVGRPSQRITFHQNGLKVTSATIVRHDKKGDIEIPVSRIYTHKTLYEVRLHADQMLYPGEYSVTMEFNAPITQSMVGIYPCYFTKDDKKHVMLMTQFESHYAREAFPCIDEPAAKATFALTLSHPAGWTALSNMPIKTAEQSGGVSVSTFETSPRMSTYLLAFVIGELQSKHTKTKNGVEIGVWGSIAQPLDGLDFALDTARGSVEFFEDYFHTPYPLPKLDHVAVPDFQSLAMENWGLITYREMGLLLYPGETSQSSKELIAMVIGHETSHQWFGNLVTMKWWDDLWLNESFANIMEYQVVDALFPEWHVWESFVTGEGLLALRRDAVPGVQPVKQSVHHPDEISTLFDPSIVYAKGGRLLYMLKNYLGEEAFRKGLTDYFKKHAYSNTEGADLWRALSAASKYDVSAFMSPWLERSGFPVITVTQDGRKLHVSQKHFLDNPDKIDNDRLWPVPLFHDRNDTLDILATREQNTDLANDEFVHCNRAARGHYIVRYETQDHRAALTKQVENQTMPALERLMLLNDSAMLAKAGTGSYAEVLELLDAYKNESTEPVWDVMSLILGESKRFVDVDESLEPKIKAFTRALTVEELKRLGWEERDDESVADRKLRGTIIAHSSYADVESVVQKAAELFEAYKTNERAIPGELRSIVFTDVVKRDVPGAVDFLLDLHDKTPNADLKRDISAALTATRNQQVATRLLERLKNPDLVKPQDADHWIFMLQRNRHTRKISWKWMEDNWGWIETTYADDKSYDYFPRYAAGICNTPEWQARYQTFFEPKKDELILRRNIEIGLEDITGRLKWLARDVDAIRSFFAKN